MQAVLSSADTADTALAVPVKLPRSKPGAAVIVLKLRVTRQFRAVMCGPPVALAARVWPGAVNAEHTSAAAHVSQPELLLPSAAVNDAGNDIAETRSFYISLRTSKRGIPFPNGAQMLVRAPSLTSRVVSRKLDKW